MMLRIEVLGGLRVTLDGRELESLPAHRVRASLLVYVACAGEVGREEAADLLWPDRDPDRARHSLNQTLYELRRELGEGCIESRGDLLRPGDGDVRVDAREFEARVEAGDLGGALELYHGHFLDGVLLADAKPLEEWQERERSRLVRMHRSARSGHIDELREGGKVEEALRHARAWVDLDPLDDEAQHALIGFLARAGRRTEALRQYDRYARLLEEELEVEPLDETKALVQAIREGDLEGEVSRLGEPAGEVPPPPASDPEGTAENGEVAEAPSGPRREPSPGAGVSVRRRWASALVLLVLGGALVVVAYTVLWSPSTETPSRPAVLVVPFASPPERPDAPEITGTFLTFLETLSGLRVYDASAMFGSEGGWRTTPMPEWMGRARELGADYIVTGDVVQSAGTEHLTVDVLDAGDGSKIFGRTGGGSVEPLARAAGRLAVSLARELAEREGVSTGLAGSLRGATASPLALAELAQAKDRFWEDDVDGAVSALRRAIAADSAFVLAYHRLSVAELWRWNYPGALEAVESGIEHASGTAPRWKELLAAQRHYVLRDADSSIVAFQNIALNHPDLVDGWFGLGEALFHYGSFAGHRPGDARRPLRRLMSMDSAFAPIADHLVQLALYEHDAEAARRNLRRMAAEAPDRTMWEAALDLHVGSGPSRDSALRRVAESDLRTISVLVGHFGHGGHALALADTLAGFLLAPGRAPEDRRRGAQYRLMVSSTDAGAWADALGTWDSVVGGDTFDRWIVHAHLAGRPTGGHGERMLARAAADVRGGRLPDFTRSIRAPPRQAFRAVVHEATLRGDSATVTTLLDAFSRSGTPARTDPLPRALRSSLRARLDLLADDTAAAIRSLERSLTRVPDPYTMFYPLASLPAQRLLLAELLHRQGREEAGRRWLRSFGTTWSLGDLVYREHVGTM